MQIPELRFFVGGLGVEATEPQLHTAFAAVGVALKHVALIVNPATGFKRGFAFVYVSSSPSGSAGSPNDFLERMRGVTLNGRKSTVSLVPCAPAARPMRAFDTPVGGALDGCQKSPDTRWDATWPAGTRN
jgi:RNA recognition motif-containing protein